MNKEKKTKNIKQPLSAPEGQLIKKVLIIILFVFVLYSNFYTLLWRIEMSWLKPQQTALSQILPSIPIITDLLDSFSVFSYYEMINRDFVIKGFPLNSGQITDSDWTDLKVVNRYFPQFLGEQQMRLYLTKHYSLGQEIHTKSCKGLAAKIRNRYNHENPDNLMKKVVIGIEFWPRGFQSYRQFKSKESLNYMVLCVED
jgi:hypothetical protein